MLELNFTKKDNLYVSDPITSVYGSALHVVLSRKGTISIYAYADDLQRKLVAQVSSVNEIFQLGIPSGLNLEVETKYEPVAKYITDET